MTDSKKNNFNNKEEALEFLLEEKFNRELKERIKANSKSEEKKTKGQLSWVRIAASVVLILGAAYFFIPSDNVSTMAGNMFEKTPLVLLEDLNTRGVNTDSDTLVLMSAQEAIKKEDFLKAQELYMMKESKQSLNSIDNYYYAWSIIKSDKGDLGKAVNLLNQVVESQSPLEKEALWLMSIAYIKLDNMVRARETLIKLKERSSYQIKNVDKLLSKIN